MTDTHAPAHGHADANADAHADAHGHGAPKHPYHLVDPSPWPIVSSIAAGMLAFGAVLYLHANSWILMIIGSIWVRKIVNSVAY